MVVGVGRRGRRGGRREGGDFRAGAAVVIVGALKGRSVSSELIGRPPHVPIFILHIILAASRKWTGSHTMGRINHGTGQSDGAV